MSPLADSEQRLLLQAARSALESALRRSAEPASLGVSEGLARRCGAFVTLHGAEGLRGCVGRIQSSQPLLATVRECALSAAFHDPRFSPVTAFELPLLSIEISVLSDLFEVRSEEIVPGEHGVLVIHGFQRALLLPQVALEWGWDREKFLEQACLKAGLSGSEWRRDARLMAFTAQVFGECEARPHTLQELRRPA
jgi:uncharacterized protein